MVNGEKSTNPRVSLYTFPLKLFIPQLLCEIATLERESENKSDPACCPCAVFRTAVAAPKAVKGITAPSTPATIMLDNLPFMIENKLSTI